ncbi:MAG: lytic transglycosylase domain-containing protein [Limnobacter sp.]|nr:lytic transglycosylase domain-containing protein [Limnobacter sp.]
MSEQVRLALLSALQEQHSVSPIFDSPEQRIDWLSTMSRRLAKRIPDFSTRYQLIKTVRYEAQRAGLDPQMVFGLIEVESNFQPKVVSSAGAIGLMQIMPFWTNVLSSGDKAELLKPAVNIRYGCLILKHYLELENGNLERALARYNGSLGSTRYPDKVYASWKQNWPYHQPAQVASKAFERRVTARNNPVEVAVIAKPAQKPTQQIAQAAAARVEPPVGAAPRRKVPAAVAAEVLAQADPTPEVPARMVALRRYPTIPDAKDSAPALTFSPGGFLF